MSAGAMANERAGWLRAGRLAFASLVWTAVVSACWTVALGENAVHGSPITKTVFAIPIVISGAGCAVARSRHGHVVFIAATSLLAIFSLICAASIGLFYYPSAVCMGFAAAQSLENRTGANT
jgi:hypothetical protein